MWVVSTIQLFGIEQALDFDLGCYHIEATFVDQIQKSKRILRILFFCLSDEISMASTSTN
jgi:hypothetical protein